MRFPFFPEYKPAKQVKKEEISSDRAKKRNE